MIRAETTLLLTHGASGNRDARLLVALDGAMTAARWRVERYNLPYRERRPSGPPSPATAERDRERIRERARRAREEFGGRVILGGHSYGGRQTSMAVAEEPELADGLLLLSYPLHPPGRPEQMRTAHFEKLRTPACFVQGERDGFASPEELRAAVALIPARTLVHIVEKAGHELGRHPVKTAGTVGAILEEFFGGSR